MITSGTRPMASATPVTSGTTGGGSRNSAGTVTRTIGAVWPASVTKRVREAIPRTATTIATLDHDSVVSHGRNTAIATATMTKLPRTMARVRRSSGVSGMASRLRLSE